MTETHPCLPRCCAPAAKVTVKDSPCGATYTIRERDLGVPLLRLAYRCKVPTLCLIRNNLAFFANQAWTYVSGPGEPGLQWLP